MAIPTAKLHKGSGQSYVYYKGKLIYFGKYGSKSADDKYWQWRATLGKRGDDRSRRRMVADFVICPVR